MVSLRRMVATRLRVVDFDESVDEYVKELRRRHVNMRAEALRARVLAVFTEICRRNGKSAEEALLPFYAAMRHRMALAPTTALSYLRIVKTSGRLRGALALQALQIAEAEAAVAEPVVRLVVPVESQLWRFLARLPAGPIKRTIAVITATGCRVADANSLKATEVRIADRVLTVAWSRMKQRRTYRHRITIEYPAELATQAQQDILLRELAVAAAVGGKPFSASVAQVNLALRRSGLFPRGVTSRSLRVRFVALVGKHVRASGGDLVEWQN